MQIQSDESLEKLNTLRLASRGKYLATVRDEDELQRSLAWARDKKTSVTVLGGGSNVVLLGDLDSLLLVQASLVRRSGLFGIHVFALVLFVDILRNRIIMSHQSLKIIGLGCREPMGLENFYSS